MRHQDFSSLRRSTVGFDRLFQVLDSISGSDNDTPSFPPYNIVQRDENKYRISMAVAGFSEDDLIVDIKEAMLSIRGDKKTESQDIQYLHRGVAQRSFERRFQLADHVEVTGAQLVNGLLHIDLVRNIPESMKPRSIKISTGSSQQNRIAADG